MCSGFVETWSEHPVSVNATQVPQDPTLSLLTLIGTWALVVVATITVVVTAWQTRRGQRMLNKQVEQSIKQTELQRRQFAELLRGEERPRIRALIRKVLTQAIQIVENNDAEIIGGFLNRKCDGFPGPQSIWVGLQRTRDFVLALEANKLAARCV